MTIKEFLAETKKGNVNFEDHIQNFLLHAKKINAEYDYFSIISDGLAISQAKELAQKKTNGKIRGLPISVKDCICVKGVESTAGSRILKGYTPIFNATCVEKCITEGGLIAGKTVQDEFGFGSFNTNVCEGNKIPLNPFDKTRVCGGSSGGAAGFMQKCDFPHIALAESTGGSIVNPASFCGVVGLCPTYGRVSRYGLIDYANSLDKIGVMGKTVSDAETGLSIIEGFDFQDSTSVESEELKVESEKMKIGMIKEAFGEGIDKGIADSVTNSVKKLESKGITYEEVSMPLTFKYGIPTYYLTAVSEASTNLAKYCGMRYGAYEELKGNNFDAYFSNVRSKYLGKEAKRRIILGTFARMAGFRDEFYLKAAKLRTKIIEEYKKLFAMYDVLISPTMPIIAPKFSEIEKLTPLQNYMMDTLTVGPNLAGLPHLTVPCGNIKGMPTGIMLIGDHFKEKKIIKLGGMIEQ